MIAIHTRFERRDHRQERARHDGQILRRREGHGGGLFVAHSGHLRPGRDVDRVRLRGGEPERDAGSSRGWREQAHAQKFKELQVVAVRHSIQPVQKQIRHPGEQLDQRDAGIGDVVVAPFGAVQLDVSLGFIHQVLEAAVV